MRRVKRATHLPGQSVDWSHEESYRGISPASWIHRARLRGILSALRSIKRSHPGTLADFGCSNGFVLAQLRVHVFREPATWTLHGFDHAQGFLDQAKGKRIPNAQFHEFNLNKIGSDWQDAFDIVLCLETLEHTGNFRNAFYNLWMSCKPGGYLVTTVPIEVGIPGIVKFFGRKLVYRRPYRRFFAERSERAYVRALLTGADLEAFRVPGESGWPEHLGFDNRRFEEFLWSEFLEQRRLVLVGRRRTAWGFGRLYILRKAFAPDGGP